jgi:dephospho-CoA kinase
VKIIGLTGSFGTGKTFVASIFRSLGAKVIDADRIAHGVIRKGNPEYKRIVKSFGKEILNEKKEIDRAKLGAVVFSNTALLRELNRIVHPSVIKEIRRSIRNAGKKDIVVIDAPLLIEASLDKFIDKLIVVKCQKRRQIERCREKFCLQKKEILRRIESQIPLKKKMKMADLVIDNSLTRSRTREQARKAWRVMLWK